MLFLSGLLGIPRAKPLPREVVRHRAAFKNSPSTIRALRHDHDRVSVEELEKELVACGLNRWGEQSKAAEICGVRESCMRGWRKGKELPTRRAVKALRDWREARDSRSKNSQGLRVVGGAK